MPEILVNVYRNQLIESFHRGDIAVVNGEGETIYRVGNARKITYWRSAAKPLQVMPVIFSGAAEEFGFTSREIAVMAASHSGEEKHVITVRNILQKIGLKESDLRCGVHRPLNKRAARKLIEEDRDPDPLHNNCSGKHAAMLALCRYRDWPVEDYRRQDHPLQQLLLQIVSTVTGYPRQKIYTGEDGCGVVVFGLPLAGMAGAYARLANPEMLPAEFRRAAREITTCMEKNPDLVGGQDRLDTDLMNVTGGKLVAKSGAEGVYCIGVHKGNGMALKITDGNKRAVGPAAVEVLSQLNVITPEEKEKLSRYHCPPVINHLDHEVGRLKPEFTLVRDI